MIQFHKFNYNESLNMYEQCKTLMAPSNCYHNMFRTMRHFHMEYLLGDYRIAYGYYRVLPDQRMMARHCFAVNTKGEAVDPTAIANALSSAKTTSRDQHVEEHYSFHIFDDIQEYYDMIEENENFPDLIKMLYPIEHDNIRAWASENNWFLIS